MLTTVSLFCQPNAGAVTGLRSRSMREQSALRISVGQLPRRSIRATALKICCSMPNYVACSKRLAVDRGRHAAIKRFQRTTIGSICAMRKIPIKLKARRRRAVLRERSRVAAIKRSKRRTRSFRNRPSTLISKRIVANILIKSRSPQRCDSPLSGLHGEGGARSADAAQALEELQTIANRMSAEEKAQMAKAPAKEPPRVMVMSQTEGAQSHARSGIDEARAVRSET